MHREEAARRRKIAIMLAVVVSVLLFALGLLSGLYVSKKIGEQQLDLHSVQSSQQQQIASLRTYVQNLEHEFQNAQLQEQFINSLPTNRRCALAQTYFEHIAANLNEYWAALPARIEEYEYNRTLSEEYLQLKEQYVAATLSAWTASSQNARVCPGAAVEPVLYFYNSSCASCSTQGEQLDVYKELLEGDNQSVIVFTLDKDYPHPVIDLLQTYYNITMVPAIVVQDTVLEGEPVYSALDIALARAVS